MDSTRLILVMKEAARRRKGETGEALQPFAGSPVAPVSSKSDERKLARYARSAVQDLSKVLRSEVPGERQAAAYLLGLSGDVRAVRPLFGMLVDGRDWSDHDYGSAALGRLGSVSLSYLEKKAIAGSAQEASYALRAIAESHGATLPVLRRIREKRRRLPSGFYSAYTDPRGLPDVIEGLEDPTTRADALTAAEELLCSRGYGRASLKRRRKWCLMLGELLGSDDIDERAQALVCIGRLGDRAQHHLVRAALDDASDDVVAAAANALAHLGGEDAISDLVGMLSRRSGWRRSVAAASLLDARLVRGATRRRAIECVIDAVTGPRRGWPRERAVLTIEQHRAAIDALLAAVKTLRGVRQRRGAEALVEVARLRKRPAATYAGLRRRLRGTARRELERAWAVSEREEARVQKKLARVRASEYPQSYPENDRPRGRSL